MGISFAIPMDEAVRVSDQLRSSGRVARGRIGVQIEQVSKEVAETIGLGKPSGALVRSVEAGAPADKAGIEGGDIITRFDGKLIEKSSDLPRIIGGTKPGSKSTITVFRRGSSKDLSITIAEVDADKPAVKASAREEKPKASTIGQSVGLAVSELNDAQRKELKIKGGVRIDSAVEAAARAGLREGDIILSVANAEVSSVKELEAALAKYDKTKTLLILFRRGELAQYAIIKPAR
jgi:serine protease Do